ncbi:putative lipase [Stachybotrys elegans]|uniref:Lipase n=1 Tax=Stachybotrys elegans TaxID=80388 RepID=A0A8K0WL44_9HYPO|nr:putative lipase [Stachybotrys elegans]
MAKWKFVSIAVLALSAALSLSTYSADTAEVKSVQTGKDPELTEDLGRLRSAVTCPVSVPGASQVVLLIHGTGMTPKINWDHTLLQPLIQQEYQPYYLEVPQRLFLDTQTTAEFISYAVKNVTQEHEAAKGGISIISWSAGGLATQWTLTFYPETRARVKRHIAIGPSYRGSWMMVPLFYFNLYSPAVVQQLPWSNFLSTLEMFSGMTAHVPTTNIGSSTDLFIQPGFFGEGWARLKDAWRLGGPLAHNIDLFKACASKAIEARSLPRIFTHDSLLWEAASHVVIMDALRNTDTYLGSADILEWKDCRLRVAPSIDEISRTKHANILPELFKYAPTQPKGGWPEVAIRPYAFEH